MKKFLLLLTALIIAGCSTVDKQILKARQTFDKYPAEAAKYCGDKFPPADSTASVITDTIKGQQIDYRPALINLESLLDSARSVLGQKQNQAAGLTSQLTFAKSQLSKANGIISNLSAQITTIKANYKPCGVDTIKSTLTKIRSNTAKMFALTTQITADGQENQKLQKALIDKNKKAAHRLYIIICLSLLMAAHLVIKIYGFFSGGTMIGSLLHK